eukprot:6539079-Alexandrium_andersonii.AAC.1
MSPTRTLEFSASLGSPESLHDSTGIAASSTPVPAGSLIDLLEGDRRGPEEGMDVQHEGPEQVEPSAPSALPS